jgi:hypothetical protein
MSERSIAQKLQIKPGRSVRLVNAPQNATALLSGLPEDTRLLDDPALGETVLPADILILFAHHRTDLETLLLGLRTAITPGGIIWVAYHKGTSLVKTDINRDSIWRYAQMIGMNAVSQVSIDDDWSAMRLKVA